MSRLHKFQHHLCPDFLAELAKTGLLILGDPEKHSFECKEADQKIFTLRLPAFYPTPKKQEPLWSYLEEHTLSLDIPKYIVLLMESGRAAIGIFEDGKVLEHKNIRKYMVRKKQGKSQLNHLKTKGKSRYGSRLRLRESEAFFDEIIERLSTDTYSQCKQLIYHCPVRLKSCLYDAAEELKFDVNQFTWTRLGVDIKDCGFEEMKRLSQEIYFCRLTVEETTVKLPEIPEYQKLVL
ncbi:hypothetical protein PQO03_03445 [Lentisphaera profundi]|uniref:VLRF1 domain-containing protein n=1 Tax=Lentisphaera profundi TaxID=1658616 RepID=A0ABY7VUX4_9BACT|nr:hypothetical protein [Lentisphaera profundi]WDE97015.1 hypothetical protein PQO03_03445 [Lentisphaera profundi]